MTLDQRVDVPLPVAALARLAVGIPSGRPVLISASMPIDPIDPIGLYGAGRELGAMLWLQPDRGVSMVGLGRAVAVPWECDRPGSASVRWRALLDEARIHGEGAAHGVGPLLLGGLAFDGQPRSATWAGFDAGHLTLPALLVTSTPGGSWLTASLVSGTAPIDASLRRLEETWGRLARPPATPSVSEPPALRLVSREPDASAWRDSVARLAGAVGRGRLDKVVLSRRVEVEAPDDIDLLAVLRRLERRAPESTVFAFPGGAMADAARTTFLGATPERLVRLDGGSFATMAMAGSTRRMNDPGMDAELAAELLASDKEREEHAVVVAMLRRELAPITAELDVAETPSVVALRHVQHLVTGISGRLDGDHDILTLVERLHPTPAVAGAPRDLALELIGEEERHDRGWYAGPVGWVDRHGDGEFVVALRSGVVSGRTATLFAGCGIVADSDPDREWDESSMKLNALASALGRLEP